MSALIIQIHPAPARGATADERIAIVDACLDYPARSPGVVADLARRAGCSVEDVDAATRRGETHACARERHAAARGSLIQPFGAPDRARRPSSHGGTAATDKLSRTVAAPKPANLVAGDHPAAVSAAIMAAAGPHKPVAALDPSGIDIADFEARLTRDMAGGGGPPPSPPDWYDRQCPSLDWHGVFAGVIFTAGILLVAMLAAAMLTTALMLLVRTG